MKRRLSLLVLCCWLLPALACNLPQQPNALQTQTAPQASATPFRLVGEGQSVPGRPAAAQPTAAPPSNSQPFAPWGFAGLNILRDFASAATSPNPIQLNPDGGALHYISQPGDTLAGLAQRFNVQPSDLHAPIVTDGLLPAGTQIEVIFPAAWVLPASAVLPDSEIVYGPAAADFSVESYVKDANAYLNSYSEDVNGQTLSGSAIVRRVAIELSINPRILLAFLEYRSGWVLGQPKAGLKDGFPIGFEANGYRGLYKELILVGRQLTIGYYFWRSGQVATIVFPDNASLRLNPTTNAGTAAVSVLLSKLYLRDDFGPALYGPKGFPAFYTWMFGDPWARAALSEPQLPDNLVASQPPLALPFAPGESWKFSGGPHADWGTGSPNGAIDFAPYGTRGCGVSALWATAAAAGVVAVSENGLLLLALDASGKAEKGWALLYLHLADEGRAAVGTQVQPGDRLGHPSCLGGVATGANLHIARKYNGEWIGAGPETLLQVGPWRVLPGKLPYQGSLLRDDGQRIEASSDGSKGTDIPH